MIYATNVAWIGSKPSYRWAVEVDVHRRMGAGLGYEEPQRPKFENVGGGVRIDPRYRASRSARPEMTLLGIRDADPVPVSNQKSAPIAREIPQAATGVPPRS